MRSKQCGFTLIEIAIVLVIIGLLLGGVLKGQELINSAKVKNLASDFKNIPVYVYSYQDKYRALPGDDKDTSTHLGIASSGGANLGNGVIDGSWIPTDLSDESLLFWQQIRSAKLVTGASTFPSNAAGIQAYLPTNAMGGTVGIQGGSTPSITGLKGSNIICSSGIPGKYVSQLDSALDDGDPTSGSMLATTKTVSGIATVTPNAVTSATEADSYTVCMGI